jgi:hypothetical protein
MTSSQEPKMPPAETLRQDAETDVGDLKMMNPSDQLDVGAQYAGQLRDSPYTHEEEVALRWRFDRRILPILFFNVILASVDKTSTSTGAL